MGEDFNQMKMLLNFYVNYFIQILILYYTKINSIYVENTDIKAIKK